MTTRDHHQLTRRDLLAGVGLAASALTIPAIAEGAPPEARWDYETDVLVVGGGAAGCTAAVNAVDRGAKVILLERAPILGGTSRKSGGVAWVPNNPLLQAKGVADPKPDCMRYLARFAYPHRYIADAPNLGLDPLAYRRLEAFYDNGSEMIAAYARLGIVEFGTFTVGGLPAPDYADHLPENKLPTGRALAPIDASGAVMQGALGHGGRIIDQCETWLTKQGSMILTEHRATRLLLEHGRIVGLEATYQERTVRVRARKGVIFATGGFAHNTDLIATHQRFLYGSCAVAHSTGDFVSIATEVGASLGPMESAWRAQVVLEDALANRHLGICLFFVPSDSMIIVNKHGRRVVNEKRSYNDRTRIHYVYDPVGEDYPNQLLFMVFDSRALDAFAGSFPIPADPNTPYLIKGDTLGELAKNLRLRLKAISDRTAGTGVADNFEAALAETVQRFNGFARTGVDADFHRGEQGYDREWQRFFSVMRKGSAQPVNNLPNATMWPIAEAGPYYAIILGAGALDTSGGPMTDERARVLDARGKPIPGLFGAGNCIAAPTRDAYMGAGGTLGPAMAYGYIAACTATVADEHAG